MVEKKFREVDWRLSPRSIDNSMIIIMLRTDWFIWTLSYIFGARVNIFSGRVYECMQFHARCFLEAMTIAIQAAVYKAFWPPVKCIFTVNIVAEFIFSRHIFAALHSGALCVSH